MKEYQAGRQITCDVGHRWARIARPMASLNLPHGGAKGSGGPPGERNGQYRHGERTKVAIAEQRKFSALLKMLRAGSI
jgi:hypothetical protein